MKKVILSAYACSPIRGSEPGNGWSWAVNLAQEGYNVWCFTNQEDKDIILKEHAKLNLPNLKFIFVQLPYSLDRKLLNTSAKSVYLHYMLWRKYAAKLAIQLHKNVKFDIGHHVTFGSLQQGTFLWRLQNIKLIFGPVGGGQFAPEGLREYFGGAWRVEQLRRFFSDISFIINKDLKETLKRASTILVTNKETEDLIKKTSYYDQNKIHFVLDNAVPKSMENLLYPEKKYDGVIRLLWVGRIMPRKGLNLVLRALSFLPSTFNYSFTIVGGGELFSQIDHWIEEYKLDNSKIIIKGQIPFSDVIGFYKTSHLFVFCSLRDSCPAQLTEAMAFGLPSIVLNIHGSALAVSDDIGIKVEVTTAENTAKDIANAIVLLSTDKVTLEQKSKNAYQKAQLNTWNKKVSQITSAYY